MQRSTEVSELYKFLNKDEHFILGVDGVLRLHIVQETLFCLVANPLFGFTEAPVYETMLKCVFAATDKRVIFIGKTSKGQLDESKVVALDYDDINLRYKKGFGGRLFIIETENKPLFSFPENKLIFEVNHACFDAAEKMNAIIKEYKI